MFHHSRPILLWLLLLGLTSAVLLAEMPPNQETAERILKARLDEFKKESITTLPTGKQSEYYRMNGEKTSGLEMATYTLEYEISPLLQEQPPLREVSLSIEWRPSPEIKQTQKLRLKSFLSSATK